MPRIRLEWHLPVLEKRLCNQVFFKSELMFGLLIRGISVDAVCRGARASSRLSFWHRSGAGFQRGFLRPPGQ